MRRLLQSFCLLALLYAGFFVFNVNNDSSSNTANAALMDYTPPNIRVLDPNGTVVPYGAYVRANYFRIEASDNLNIYGIVIRILGRTDYQLYRTSYYTAYAEGEYEFFAEDMRGNRSNLFRVTLDRTPPPVTIYADEVAIYNNDYINADRLRFYTADNTAVSYISTDGSYFYSRANNAIYYNEGTYWFYARDRAGNYSNTIRATLDRTKPDDRLMGDGKLITEPESVVSANQLVYSAYDRNPFNVYAKLPGSDSYTTTISGSVYTEEGVYSFYSSDRAGNRTDTKTVLLDRTKPVVELVSDSGQSILSGDYINAAYITAQAMDSLSGVRSLYVKLPGAEEYTDYLPSTRLYDEGEYLFYAEDLAGNISDVISVTIDKTPPMGSVIAGENYISSEGFTNTNFYYIASDSVSGIAYFELKKPHGNWEEYVTETVIKTDFGDGVYVFRSIDNAGNVSEKYLVTLDTSAPVGRFYALDRAVESGGYTNALRISFMASDDNLDKCYVKAPNSEVYEQTNSGALYSDEGMYSFFAVDKASNVSDEYCLTVDRQPKELILAGVINGTTDRDVTVTWDNIEGFAPVISVTVNGCSYDMGDIIQTINNGVYEVKSYDIAGNVWSAVFIANRVDILTVTYNKFWWEAKDKDGNAYSFDEHEKALSFATDRERSFVRSMVWNNDTWDSGIMMDSVDSANAKQGTFYLYKKSDDPSVNVAYFTWDRLNAVILSYAEEGIAKYYYWQKTPAMAYGGNSVTQYSDGRYIIADSVSLGDAKYMVDGVVMYESEYSVPGEHTLTVFDDWGDSYDIRLVITETPPQLLFRYGNGDYYHAEAVQPYYLKNRITLKIIDNVDELAMGIVLNSNREIIHVFSLREELILPERGKYIVQTVNHSGIFSEYIFHISYTAPNITANENKVAKRLDITFTPSPDKDVAIEYIRVYRSYNGTEWIPLVTDDYGVDISANVLKYSFFKTGYYRFIVEDTCRTGIDAVILETYYHKPEPGLTTNNLPENGHTNKPISFVWTDEAYMTMRFSGEEREYLSGTELTKEGEYVLIFRDYDLYEKSYAFVIDKTPPKAKLSVEPVKGFITEQVALSFEDNCTAYVYLNEKLIGKYLDDTAITEDGEYIIEVFDLAGNVTVLEFIKDTIPPSAQLIGVENGGTVKGVVTLKTVSESVTVEAYLNGEKIMYTLGESLKSVGSYRIVLTDEAGLTTEYTFEILYYLNGASVAVIIVASFALIGGLIGIIALRKRGKFRKSKI